jgi:hypothetical protein
MSAENSVSKASRPRGRVHWRRFAYVAVPSVAVAAVLIGMTAQGSIASSISVSGQEFLITADQLNGNGFVQFGNQLTSDQNGKNVTVPVMESGIHSATMTNLCQSLKVGPVTMRLTAGGNGNPVRVSNMVVDASGQTGSQAIFHNITIGQDASTVNKDGGETGAAGGFAQQADSVTIDNLRQNTWLTTAGTFSLPGLSLGFGKSC